MSEEKKTPKGNNLEAIEKKSFWKKCKEKKEGFKNDHPKAYNVGSTIIKVGGGIATGIGLKSLFDYFTGSKNDGPDMIACDDYVDYDVVSDVNNEDN